MHFFTNLPASILQPPNFPFWAMDTPESNCIELDLGHSSNVRCKTYSKKTRLLSLSNPLAESFSDRAERLKVQAQMQSAIATLAFRDAAEIWLRQHSRYIKQRTIGDYEQYIGALNKVFGNTPLNTIDVHQMRAYQDWREQTAGAPRINMELSTLQQVLKEAKLWAEIMPLYRPLPVSTKGSGRSASKDEVEKLLTIAFANRRRLLAAHCIKIMIRSGFGFGELRHVRRRDVSLVEKSIFIDDGAKNGERERTFPFHDETWSSVLWLLDRWEQLGGRKSDEYILPHCSARRNGPRDFTRPMLSIKKAWHGIRAEAVEQIGPHMAKFRIYDCRVTAVTRALSSGKVPIYTAKKMFGHISEAMQKRYYKPELDILRDAAKVLEDAV